MADDLALPFVAPVTDRVIMQEATIFVDLPVDKTFSLFDPQAEKKWVHGWDPRFISPVDGVICEKMVFLTQPRFEGEPAYQWIVMKYDPFQHVVVYCVSTQERIWFVEVGCERRDGGCAATVRYTYVALTDSGAVKNAKALHQMFAHNLLDWQEAIEDYLGKNM